MRTARTKTPPLRGLRWVPVPLAILVSVLGWLVVGAMQGQAAADHALAGYQAGGLGLTVDTMLWMSNDMTGQGPVKSNPNFGMPQSQMPGMQPANDNRLRVEVNLRNATTGLQRYSLSEFRAVSPDGKSWMAVTSQESDSATSGAIEPGFQMTVDMYFDVPSAYSNNLHIQWSHDGGTLSIPVGTTNASPGPMHM